MTRVWIQTFYPLSYFSFQPVLHDWYNTNRIVHTTSFMTPITPSYKQDCTYHSICYTNYTIIQTRLYIPHPLLHKLHHPTNRIVHTTSFVTQITPSYKQDCTYHSLCYTDYTILQTGLYIPQPLLHKLHHPTNGIVHTTAFVTQITPSYKQDCAYHILCYTDYTILQTGLYIPQPLLHRLHHPTNGIVHTTAFVTQTVGHWLERVLAEWVHQVESI